jgi:hypothetical protein
MFRTSNNSSGTRTCGASGPHHTTQQFGKDRPQPGKPRITREPRQHRVSEGNNLLRIGRAFQPKQQCRQCVTPLQVGFAEGTLVDHMVAYVRLPSPQRRVVG